MHYVEINHNFNLKNSKMLVYIHNKNARKLLNVTLFLTTTLLNKDLIFSTYLLI